MAYSNQYRGTGVAMITPFKQNGETDFNRLSILTDKLISNGINYLVVLGTTAETPTLSKSEKSDVESVEEFLYLILYQLDVEPAVSLYIVSSSSKLKSTVVNKV